MNYGKSIRQFRVNLNQTQSEFSAGVGITQTYLSQIETGKKKPSTDVLERIADYSGVDMPIMLFFASEEADIREDKREAYRLLKPAMDGLLENLFDKED